ncbi:unnamed protein product [Ixodes persulcatus]
MASRAVDTLVSVVWPGCRAGCRKRGICRTHIRCCTTASTAASDGMAQLTTDPNRRHQSTQDTTVTRSLKVLTHNLFQGHAQSILWADYGLGHCHTVERRNSIHNCRPSPYHTETKTRMGENVV